MAGFAPVAGIVFLAHEWAMRLKILEADILIGAAEVFALDPPMAVVMAKFFPAVAYDRGRHANVIDGIYIGDRSEILQVEMEDGSTIKCVAISIHDYPTLDERELHILGICEPHFDELFKEHPSFIGYWGKA